jgi:hypothetical protein
VPTEEGEDPLDVPALEAHIGPRLQEERREPGVAAHLSWVVLSVGRVVVDAYSWSLGHTRGNTWELARRHSHPAHPVEPQSHGSGTPIGCTSSARSSLWGAAAGIAGAAQREPGTHSALAMR